MLRNNAIPLMVVVLCHEDLLLCQKDVPFGLKETKNCPGNSSWERATGLDARSTEYHV
jgi:hypothetical protein